MTCLCIWIVFLQVCSKAASGSTLEGKHQAGEKCLREKETHALVTSQPGRVSARVLVFSELCFSEWELEGLVDVHAAPRPLAHGCAVARKGSPVSLDYLYPAFMQSQICGWEAGSFGNKKILQEQMLSVSYTSPLIAAMCERVRVVPLPPGQPTEALSAKSRNILTSRFLSLGSDKHTGVSPHRYWVRGHHQRAL